ncbi:unnamed protein product [Adineta ricciae]|uniref:Uncharacterized protein n=1 Tax=Adineta ricciae TaxID=249248 RepID=A0A815Q1C3_ADIRI|nr:unnamed protein product [Adineta ricciae]
MTATSKLKQQQQNTATPTLSSGTGLTTTKSDLRKKEGLQRRRSNTSKLKKENADLRASIRHLTIENNKLKLSRQQTPPRPSPTEILLDNISPSSKKRGILRIKDQKEYLPRGSARDFRKKLGVNLSNSNAPKKTTPSILRNAIEQFLLQDHISKLCPDKNKVVGDHQVRYRLNHLSTLHQTFEYETDIVVDYVTFTRYVPDYIQKPTHENWGTCLCVVCLNPQMKFEKLKQLKQKHPSIQPVIHDTPLDLSELVKDENELEKFKRKLMKLNDEKLNITYSEWQKIKKPDCVALVSTKLQAVKTFLSQPLKLYVRKFLRTVSFLIHLGAYYFEQHIALLTGYVWLKGGSFSFGCVSDDTNHMSEATWASTNDLLQELVHEKEITIINMISDSPVSQFRNKTTIYLMKQFAMKEQVDLKWIFLEAGHGKGVADAVGAALKINFDEVISYKPDDSFKNAMDLLDAVENSSNIKLFIYDKSDIKTLKKSIPKLVTVKGTAEFHEIIATKDGALYAKNVSSAKEKQLKAQF